MSGTRVARRIREDVNRGPRASARGRGATETSEMSTAARGVGTRGTRRRAPRDERSNDASHRRAPSDAV